MTFLEPLFGWEGTGNKVVVWQKSHETLLSKYHLITIGEVTY